MEIENKVEFLWKAANSLTPTNHTNKLLKSYYLTLCRKITAYKYNLPKEKFADLGMCNKCSSCWFDGNFSVQLVSATIRSSKAKRLVEALTNGHSLSKRQKKRAKWYQKKIFSNLEFTCKLCNCKTKIRLKKSNKNEQAEKMNEEIPILQRKKKKNIKKVDKFAGIKIEPVKKSYEKTNSRQRSKDEEKNDLIKPRKSKTNSETIESKIDVPKEHQKKSEKPSLNIEKVKNKTTNNSEKNKSKQKIQNSSMNKKKSKNKQSVKIVSKTQQKNTILQLAQMLKQGNLLSSSSSQNNKTNDRLKNLLR